VKQGQKEKSCSYVKSSHHVMILELSMEKSVKLIVLVLVLKQLDLVVTFQKRNKYEQASVREAET
jgi:hypothetical protein